MGYASNRTDFHTGSARLLVCDLLLFIGCQYRKLYCAYEVASVDFLQAFDFQHTGVYWSVEMDVLFNRIVDDIAELA